MNLKQILYAIALPAAMLLSAQSLPAQPKCVTDKAELSKLQAELKQDTDWLAKNCANALSAECTQQGPGMRQAVQLLNQEIAAEQMQMHLDCAPPPTPTPTPVLHVRQSIATLSPAQIASLRKGIQVMMSRKITDPTSYQFQANIHGTYDTATTPQQTQGWNQCEHGSFYFFSWHRMYLYFFERILRKASGDPSLALPYWNWSDPAQRSLPVPFRQPSDPNTNSLFIPVPNRPLAVDDGTGQLPDGVVSFSTAFTYTNFSSPAGSGLSFGGQTTSPVQFNGPHGELESQPHDVVHGTLSGLMGDPNTAAQDPIFWLHHANIDRLWKRWLDQGGGRQDPVGDANWMTNTIFTFFDENGQAVPMTGAQIIKTVAELDYRYDDDPNLSGALEPQGQPVASPVAETQPVRQVLAVRSAAGGRAQLAPVSLRFSDNSNASVSAGSHPDADVTQPTRQALAVRPAPEGRTQLTQAPLTVSLPFSKETSTQLKALLARPAGRHIVLQIDDIQYAKPPGIYYEVYLNLPKGATPDFHGPNFVGNLSFFALMPHTMPKAGERTQAQPVGGGRDFDITKVVSDLVAKRAWNDSQATVTFIVRGLVDRNGRQLPISPGAKASFGKVTIAVE